MDDYSVIIRMIKRIRRRLMINSMVRYGLFWGAFGLLSGAVLNFFAIWFPIVNGGWIGLLLGAAGMIAGILWAAAKRPSLHDSALYGDSKGLKESLVTAFERRDRQDVLSVAQRKQTRDLISCFNPTKAIPFQLSLPPLAGYFLAAVFLAVCILIPSLAKKELNRLVKEQERQIEELKQELQKQEETEFLGKEEILHLLDEALKEVRAMEEEGELQKIMERMSMKLKKEEEQIGSQEFSEMADLARESLSLPSSGQDQEKMKSLAQALEQQLRDKAGEKENGLSEEEIQNIAQELSRSGEGSGGNISEGDAGEKVKELAKQLDMSPEELEDMMKDAQASVKNGEAGNKQKGSDENGDGELADGGSEQDGGKRKEDGGAGNSGGSGNGNGNGGGASGQGDSQGSGKGTGTGYDKGGKTGFEKAGSSGNAPEELHIPNRKQGKDENLTGQASGGSSYYTETEQGLTWRGESKDYRQVAGEYTEEAYKKISGQEIPEAVKGVVKDYFSGLAK